MPCRSDHMEPTAREHESQEVAWLLCYVKSSAGEWASFKLTNLMQSASRSDYGEVSMVDEWTALLCATIRELPEDLKEKIIWNGRDANARRLAAWWDRHEAWDIERERKELKELETRALAKEAVKKISQSELNAIKFMFQKGEL